MNTSSQMAFVTFVRSMGFVLALGASIRSSAARPAAMSVSNRERSP